MTSRADPRANTTFVYITLPGTTEMVVAGRLETVVETSGIEVGRFVYGRSYLDRRNAVPLDPVEINVVARQRFDHVGDKGMFGAIRDASPDYWGRFIIDRALGAGPTEIGYLLNSPDDRIGALGFGLSPTPPAPLRKFNRTLDLGLLMATADAVQAGRDLPDHADTAQAAHLLQHGTSMGGARPKAVVEDGGALWLAKFTRPDDNYDLVHIEHATLKLAAECGIETAFTRTISIAGRPVLLVKRFDRDLTDGGWLRHRMVSALTVLQGSENDRSNWSYLRLADRIRQFGKVEGEDRIQLFRRIAFNILVNNDDDHPRNTALTSNAGGWRLSPAYDLVPKPVLSQQRFLAMEIGTGGRSATRENLLSQSPRFALDVQRAAAIINEIQSTIAQRWYPVFREAGVTAADCESVRAAMLNPGFEWRS
ncbi:type II toxin-antitoxin system HipA family toxin [Phyllobacterium sophorae]|uniref:Type II toxin-antitoxin system HipA family toxin n=1 Tax=Phyllobacterium sophorae TaxID=1520277 RepID=A0A2P7AXH9_9HYPH|nr:HipA domain-containing protein [Phyllobacterium sophorae]PSH58922.1 type II toxin-antitoxin system HipA family toxin [Phyllobacterium sophorae]